MTSDYLVSFPGLGIHDLPISRVAFSVFGIDVYWYGMLIALAAVLCIFLSTREAKKFGLNPDFVTDNFLVLLPSMIIGARLYYVIFSWDMYKDDLLSIFDTRKGGLAFYGGVIGGFLGMLIFHKIKKQKFEPFLDFIACYVPLGQAIGRIGNFVNQEAFGTNTNLPWGMISNGTRAYLAAHPELGQNPDLPVHPTFLYEFIGNMILFALLHRFRKNNKIPYGTVAFYFLGYGVIRFFVEGIRTDSLYIGQTDIRASQLLSALMVIAAILYLLLLRKKRRAVRAANDDALFEAAKAELSAAETLSPIQTEQKPSASAAQASPEAGSESSAEPDTTAPAEAQVPDAAEPAEAQTPEAQAQSEPSAVPASAKPAEATESAEPAESSESAETSEPSASADRKTD